MTAGESRIPRPHFRVQRGASAIDAAEGVSGSIDAREELSSRLDDSIARTSAWLWSRQHEDGHWCAELEGDTILESEYILLLAWLGKEKSPIARKAAAYMLQRQLPEGGWAMYPGGKLEISQNVKAYFALKLTGHDPEAPYMQKAREAIRAAGGADAVNSFTRFYLALLGQISYDYCPAVPPELVLLPRWSPVNLYRMSAWSRTIVVPLAIMWAHRPSRTLPPELGIEELFLKPPAQWPELRCPGLEADRGLWSWDKFFRRVDTTLKWCERYGVRPLRKRALRKAEKWMTDRFAHSDGLGAIFPPIIWSIVALKCLGYRDDSPELRYNFEQLEALTIEEEDTARLQPCLSPVWDTVITLRALATAGANLDETRTATAIDWLLSKEVTRPGDWAQNVSAPPGGWFFEYHNEFYPDVDDSIMAMIALHEVLGDELVEASGLPVFKPGANSLTRSSEASRMTGSPNWDDSLDEVETISQNRRRWAVGACERARRWVLAMQNRDGGWGAFDKDNDSEFLCRVPFADHNAMIDPSTPDLTGRVLEALARWGGKRGQLPVEKAIRYLRRTQEADGSWFGRWGVNYIYGTWQAIVGLTAIGVPTSDEMVQRGVQWLLQHQQACGGWGESADTYEQPELRGKGPVTASQTAWALLGLLAAGLDDHPAVERGIRYLMDTQLPDGSWDEQEYTGTGFPRVFYLKYHYYPIYFPLLALAQWRRQRGSRATQAVVRSMQVK